MTASVRGALIKVSYDAVNRPELGVISLRDVNSGALVQRDDEVHEIHRVEIERFTQGLMTCERREIGFGTILPRPWVIGDRIEPRPLVAVSLAADHRTTDGHIGALLLNAIGRLLQEPHKL